MKSLPTVLEPPSKTRIVDVVATGADIGNLTNGVFLRALSRMQRPGNMAIREIRMRTKMIMNSITAKTF